MKVNVDFRSTPKYVRVWWRISKQMRRIQNVSWTSAKRNSTIASISVAAAVAIQCLCSIGPCIQFCGNDMICLNVNRRSLVHVCDDIVKLQLLRWLKRDFIRKNWFHVCRCTVFYFASPCVQCIHSFGLFFFLQFIITPTKGSNENALWNAIGVCRNFY